MTIDTNGPVVAQPRPRQPQAKASEVLKGIVQARRALRMASDAVERRDAMEAYRWLEKAQHRAFEARRVLAHGGEYQQEESDDR